MNKLSTEKSARVVACLVEGMSIRGTCRITGVARQTVNNPLLRLGRVCSDYQDAALRNLDVQRAECDEIWSFVGAKDKNTPADKQYDPNYGSVWTRIAIDSDTKLMVSWLVGDRSTADCYDVMADLKSRIRVGNRIQLTTDGYGSYPPVVDALWRNAID